MTVSLIEGPLRRPPSSWNASRPAVDPAEIRDGISLFPKFSPAAWQKNVGAAEDRAGAPLKVIPFREITDAISDGEVEDELVKSRFSPEYFIDQFCWIKHPVKGLIRFKMFDYQRLKVLPGLYTQQYFITRKFRQGGFSTLTMAYSLWMAMFETDKEILILSKTDREAKGLMSITQTMWNNLPPWLKCRETNKNKSQLSLETGSQICAYTPKAGRSFAISFLVVDEAAFIDGMENLWADMFPTVSTGGQAAAVSTVNGVGNWYHKTWIGAERCDNDFTNLFARHTEHPDYADPEWENRMRRQLGERRYRQEVLAEFLGSKDTYVPYNRLKEIVEFSESEGAAPIKSRSVPLQDGRVLENALLVWEEPIPGRQYAAGVDVGTGAGQDADHSVVSVIDSKTLRQVAEFGSNEIATTDLAHAAAIVGTYYNTASLCVEANSIGSAVIDVLVNGIYYEATYSQQPGKPGITLSGKNRPIIMNLLHQALSSGALTVLSQRTSSELTTWIWNARARRPEHEKGYHDDYVLALAFALFAREDQLRNAPIISFQETERETDFYDPWDEFSGKPKKRTESIESFETPDTSVFSVNPLSRAAMAFALTGDDAPLDAPIEPSAMRPSGRDNDDVSELLREFGW